MVEEITSIDFPSLPKESEEKYDGPTIDPDHSWTGYHRWESTLFYRPLFYVWRQYLEYYGWYLLVALITTLYLYNKLHPVYYRWKRAREDAEYHKDPDRIRRNLESTQLAREIQQQLLLEESHSQRAAETDTQRDERFRQERAQFLERLENGRGSVRKEQKIYSNRSDLPLEGGGAISNYRPPSPALRRRH